MHILGYCPLTLNPIKLSGVGASNYTLSIVMHPYHSLHRHLFPWGYEFKFSCFSLLEDLKNSRNHISQEMGKWLICIRVYYEILGFCLGSGSLGDILFPSQSESHEGKYSYYKCTGSKLHNYRVSVRTWLYLLCSWCNLSSSGHRFDKKVPHPNTNGAGLDRSLVSKNTQKKLPVFRAA